MSYQKALSAFILHNDTSALPALFEGEIDTSIANIYRNGFYRSCHEVLSSTFPSVQTFAGNNIFKTLALAFIDVFPPTKGSLTGYGENFSQWLLTQPIKIKTILSELARLDWAWITCLHAVNAMPLTAEIFQNCLLADANNLPNIHLIENAQLVTSTEQTVALWFASKKDNTMHTELNSIEQLTSNLCIDKISTDNIPNKTAINTQVVLLWRPEMEVFARVLEHEEAHFIKAIQQYKNINDASEYQLERHPQFNLPEQFSNLLQHGVLSLTQGEDNA